MSISSSTYERKVTTMEATWTLCTPDGFVYIELEPTKPSLCQRHFDWRDSVSDMPLSVPASCRTEADTTPRKAKWFEMKDMSSTATPEDEFEDIDLEGFDTTGPEKRTCGKRLGKKD
ncbi:hypothetical protein E8E11_002141 [Didymella keratinophila]|nr:hypothetical protein E8E11_002141 [Didymella keratinophila]